MLHFTCDHCGRKLEPDDDERYVVKIETYAADDANVLTEADLDEDHMEAVTELLRDMEDCPTDAVEANKLFRYDLCEECHKRFVQDPLGKENAPKLFFSKN